MGRDQGLQNLKRRTRTSLAQSSGSKLKNDETIAGGAVGTRTPSGCNAAALVFFLFDLLYLDGEDVGAQPLIERKARLAALLSNASSPLHCSDHQAGHGRAFHEKACAMALEGIVSKRADAPYAPGNRGLWVKVKCLYREEFVVVGWTDPEGTRPWLGALLLAYYDPHARSGALPHEVTVIKGRRFPTCRHSKGISFELAHAAKHVGEIDHLEEAHAPAE
jgi:ATP-dependent DNA ligase